jgi:arylsulfatase A-like enzyme
MKQQGYNCAAVGKWHLGYGTAEVCDYSKELKPGPLEIGFDYHFGVPSNHGDVSGVYVENHWVYGLDKSSPTSPSPEYLTMQGRRGQKVKTLNLNAPKRVDDEVMSTLTDKLLAWMSQQTAEKPFFVYFTPVAVHNPITPSKATAGKSKGGPFCDFLSDLDISVGRVLDALDKQNLADNTLILFSSDNGGVNKPQQDMPQTTAQKAGLNPVGPFRGGKHDVWEGGFRVPYLVRWPGHVPAGTVCDETVSLVDTLATLASITGVTLPKAAEAAEDSHDVSKAWLGQQHPSPIRPDVIVHGSEGLFAIRKGPYKWIEGVPADDTKKSNNPQAKRMLYDLKSDAAEANDISAQHATVVKELEQLLNLYRDAGYSREMPPPGTKAAPVHAALPPLANAQPVNLEEFKGSSWTAREGAMFGKGADKGALLSGPIDFQDGTLEFQALLGKADRLSLRIHSANNTHSYRVVISGSQLDIAKNADPGKPAEDTLPLTKKRVRFKRGEWQTLRLTFAGEEMKAEFVGTTTTVKHPVMAQPKAQLNFIAFGGEVGIRSVALAK